MIKLEKTEVHGWEAAIRGMRNPMNSWDKSDTDFNMRHPDTHEPAIGEADLKLMKSLCSAGSDHRKFMRFVGVTVDITAPLYWWKEFDTYKVGTVANSCSTMHKIAAKEFVLDDFSHEHLVDSFTDNLGTLCMADSERVLNVVVNFLNYMRERFLLTKDKKYWWQMIQLLPSSYNQKRTVFLNYEVLLHIYTSRRNHKLDEWRTLCDWIESLPYFKEIVSEL